MQTHVDSEQLLSYEKELWQKHEYIAGVDEVGRGPIAGPVAAAAVILKKNSHGTATVRIDDSKKLTKKQREEAYKWITQNALSYAVGIIRADEIDRVNILEATTLAMKKAILELTPQPEHLLIDGRAVKGMPYSQTNIVGGDGKSLSIAAASIIAKVVRDKIMEDYALKYSVYDFHKNKGYGTAKHVDAIVEHGFSPIHRRSFRLKKLEARGFYHEAS